MKAADFGNDALFKGAHLPALKTDVAELQLLCILQVVLQLLQVPEVANSSDTLQCRVRIAAQRPKDRHIQCSQNN